MFLLRFTVLALPFALLAACDVTEEGDRCNANLTLDPPNTPEQCDKGLVCTTPDNCTSAACCPADAASSNPNCQACPAPDAGDMGDAGMGEGG